MSNIFSPAYLLKEARKRSGLSQRELARRAKTSQSVIARIENEKTSPTVATLNHLLATAGFELKADLVIRPIRESHMLDDVSRILSMTPEQRLQEVSNFSQFEAAVRHV
jgi:transcriptional regulator with XRE-family HTH domain